MKHFTPFAPVHSSGWERKIFTLLCFIFLLCGGLQNASAQSGQGWSLNGSTLTLTSDNPDGKWWGLPNLKITEIHFSGNVTAIQKFGFRDGYPDLQKITIGPTVETIGFGAFVSVQLTSVEFDKNSQLKEIGGSAFSGTKLTSVTIPASVVTIDDVAFGHCNELETVRFASGSRLQTLQRAFFDCPKLRTITIPASVETMFQAFNGCQNLETVSFENNSRLQKIEGSFQQTALRKITIPANVEDISNYAFLSCKNMESISFESDSHLKTIGMGAFQECGLKSITIPARTNSIGRSAFNLCANLVSVQFEPLSQLKEIGPFAFTELPLQTIRIPASVEIIAEAAFKNCANLQTIQFEDDSRLNILEKEAFSYTALTTLRLPKHLQTLQDNAITCCSQLTDIQFEEGSELKTIGNNALFRNQLKSLLLPDGLESIGDGALSENQLTTLNIPASVTYIGTSAFATNPLTTASFQATTPPTLADVPIFSNCGLLTDIFVPIGATQYADALPIYRNLIRYTLLAPPTTCTLDGNHNYTLQYNTEENGWTYSIDGSSTPVPFTGTLKGKTTGELKIESANGEMRLTFESPASVNQLTIASGAILHLEGSVEVNTLANQGILLLADHAKITGITDGQVQTIGMNIIDGQGITGDIVGSAEVSLLQGNINLSPDTRVALSPGTMLVIAVTPQPTYQVESVTVGENPATLSPLRSSTLKYTYEIRGSELNLGVTVLCKSSTDPGPGPTPTPTPEPEPDPTYYTITLPEQLTGAILTGGGIHTVPNYSYVGFTIELDPNGTGQYPAVYEKDHPRNSYAPDENGQYRIYPTGDQEIVIGEVPGYTHYHLALPQDSVFEQDSLYWSGVGIQVAGATGETSESGVYAAPFGTLLTLQPAADARRIFRQWEDGTALSPRSLRLREDTEVKALYRQVSPLGNAAIASGSVKVYTSDAILYVETTGQTPVAVYTSGGQVVFSGPVEGRKAFAGMPSGVYMIYAGGQTWKILL